MSSSKIVKETIVFIIDTSSSMGRDFLPTTCTILPNHNLSSSSSSAIIASKTTTRLSIAKDMMQRMISDLLYRRRSSAAYNRSSTSCDGDEVGVVVLKTKGSTYHHLSCIDGYSSYSNDGDDDNNDNKNINGKSCNNDNNDNNNNNNDDDDDANNEVNRIYQNNHAEQHLLQNLNNIIQTSNDSDKKKKSYHNKEDEEEEKEKEIIMTEEWCDNIDTNLKPSKIKGEVMANPNSKNDYCNNNHHHHRKRYYNLTELTCPTAGGGSGLCRPTIDLLQKIAKIEITDNNDENDVSNSDNNNDENDMSSGGDGNVAVGSGGDILEGISLAVDSLHRRCGLSNDDMNQNIGSNSSSSKSNKSANIKVNKGTNHQLHRKRIIIITDACQRLRNFDEENLQTCINQMRLMGCDLHVIGLGFDNDGVCDTTNDVGGKRQRKQQQHSISFPHPINNENNDNDEDSYDGYNNVDDNDDSNMVSNSDNNSNNNNSDAVENTIRYENIKLLTSITRYTGGGILAISNHRDVNDAILSFGDAIRSPPLQPPRTTIAINRGTKIELIIAPKLIISARVSILASKVNLPTLKKEAILIDHGGCTTNSHNGNFSQTGKEKFKHCNNNIMTNGNNEILTTPLTALTTHWDIDNPNYEVLSHRRTKAVRYGCDLVPLGTMDYEGLKHRASPNITILGYVRREKISLRVLIGPSRMVSGEEKKVDDGNNGGGGGGRACVAVSALATALQRLNQVAICTYVARKDSDPVMGILLPMVNSTPISLLSKKKPVLSSSLFSNRLVLVRMAYACDIVQLSMRSLTEKNDEEGEFDKFYDSSKINNDNYDNNNHNQNVYDKSSNDNNDNWKCSNNNNNNSDNENNNGNWKDNNNINGINNDNLHQLRSKTCDELIDSLILPDDVLHPGTIPNPAIQCFRRTVIARAVDPTSNGEIIPVREVKDKCSSRRRHHHTSDRTHNVIISNKNDDGDDNNDDLIGMYTPSVIMRNAQNKIDTFRSTFVLLDKGDGTSGMMDSVSGGRDATIANTAAFLGTGKKKFWGMGGGV